MVHRMDVLALHVDESREEILRTIRESGLSRFPVYDNDIDDIIGVLNTRDFLLNAQLDEPKPLRELLRPAYLVPETVPADTLFSNMQKQKKHLAIVVDEYGGMSGIVTMEDLLEEIVGNIYDEFDPSEDAEIEKLGDNLWRVTGTVDLETLAKALDVFAVDPAGMTACDIGASNGGFTDCLLQHGAAHVFAVDVAYGILAWELREDARVTVMERTNARNLTLEQLEAFGAAPLPCQLVTADVSFISLKRIFPAADRVLREDGECLCLIKPQFEAQPRQLGKNGIVKDLAILPPLLLSLAAAARDSRLFLRGLTVSPIHGTNGNVEYLAAFSRRDALDEDETAALVAAALAEQPDE